MPRIQLPIAEPAPRVGLDALDELWFQVSGTVCNLRCHHCFISCAPDNHDFWFMSRETVVVALEEAVELGVKEVYFTGGEPFMNREIEGMLTDALAVGPATVLTNATLLPPRRVRALAGLSARSRYTLELRVSLDGTTAETNDAIRGPGAFDRCVEGIRNLVAEGFLPIVTCMRSWPEDETARILEAFRELLASLGYDRPRIKILPPFRIGGEARRTHGYAPEERVTHEMLHGFDASHLLCTRTRLVTARGVYACPILLGAPSARLGDSLAEAAAEPAPLAESACFTCYMEGSVCSNVGSVAGAGQ